MVHIVPMPEGLLANSSDFQRSTSGVLVRLYFLPVLSKRMLLVRAFRKEARLVGWGNFHIIFKHLQTRKRRIVFAVRLVRLFRDEAGYL